jgi:hypothetical protein
VIGKLFVRQSWPAREQGGHQSEKVKVKVSNK